MCACVIIMCAKTDPETVEGWVGDESVLSAPNLHYFQQLRLQWMVGM